jgi:hypothetical protein
MRSLSSTFLMFCLLIPFLFGSPGAQEHLSVDQILDRAYQREKASRERLQDYICQATAITREPQKDGPAKTLTIVEKTIYRKLPDKRMEKYTAVTEEGKVLSAQEVDEFQKNQQGRMSTGSGSFLEPESRAHYSFQLMPPDTLRDQPCHVVRIKPNEKSTDLIDGRVWLHQESFEVIKMDFRPAKNPKFVKSLSLIIDFGEVQAGFWLPTEMKIDAKAGFLFMKKHFHVHETRRDYQINVTLPDSIFSAEQ